MQRLYYWLHRITTPHAEKNEYSGGHWSYLIRKETLSLCRGLQGRLLEVGCGEGLFLLALAKENPGVQVLGIDNNTDRLELARQRTEALGLRNVRFLLSNAEDLSLKDNFFDVVVCINVILGLSSLAEVRKCLLEMMRVCRKGGVIIFDIRNSRNPLLRLKYTLAPFYDSTLKGISLKSYNLDEIVNLFPKDRLCVVKQVPLGFPKGKLAPISLIFAQNK